MKDTEVRGAFRGLASFETWPDCIKGMERKYMELSPLPVPRDAETGTLFLPSPDGGGVTLLKCVRDTFNRRNSREATE